MCVWLYGSSDWFTQTPLPTPSQPASQPAEQPNNGTTNQAALFYALSPVAFLVNLFSVVSTNKNRSKRKLLVWYATTHQERINAWVHKRLASLVSLVSSILFDFI